MEFEAVKCPICGSNQVRLRWKGDPDWMLDTSQTFYCTSHERRRPEILRCSQCTHHFSNPQYWPRDLGHQYELVEDEEYLEILDIKRKTFSRAADFVQMFVEPPARLLEVGSYAGVFLTICQERGFDVTGVEPSVWGADVARAAGVTVRQGTAEKMLSDSDGDSFDAVTSWDVIEHVPDPAAFLRLLASCAKPGGYVIVSTMVRDNWFARMTGKRWPWLIPMHLHYFDFAAVQSLGHQCGLTLVKTTPHVHWTSATYALTRLLRLPGRSPRITGRTLSRIVFPVRLGDVQVFAFHKPRPA